MSEFQIQEQRLQSGIVHLTVAGFLDAHTFEELERKIMDLFAQGTYRIVVDLAQLDYISSAGAGVFIGAIGTARENEGNIVLVNPSPNVKEVFDLLGLSQIFSFADDLKGALRVFQST